MCVCVLFVCDVVYIKLVVSWSHRYSPKLATLSSPGRNQRGMFQFSSMTIAVWIPGKRSKRKACKCVHKVVLSKVDGSEVAPFS